MLHQTSVDMAHDVGGVASDYSLLEELGSGSFGTVFKAIQRTNSEVVAIKMVRYLAYDPSRPDICLNYLHRSILNQARTTFKRFSRKFRS